MIILNSLKKILRAAPPVAVEPSQVPTERLQKCFEAGAEAQAFRQSLAAEGRTPLDVVLNGNPFEKWEMYPWQGGILDQRTSSQYFYHSHPEYKGEHGHFHTFYYRKRKLAHLVAIGMDGKGRVNKLYTFNRWSPGDHYYPAQQLKTFLPRFRIANAKELDRRLHGFITNTLAAFRPEIEWLFDERDETFRRYRERHNGQSPYEDRSLEITSSLPVDLDEQVERLRRELEQRGETVRESAPPPTAKKPAAEPSAEYLDGEIQPAQVADISLEQLERIHQAGLDLRAIMDKLQAAGTSVVELVMNGKEMEDWEMYPWDEGIFDKKTRSQYFYHHHPQTPDHGHFHPFYHHGKQLAHLVAIAMDNQGRPIELFTVNRWVTDEVNLPPEKLIAYVPRFRMDSHPRFEDVHLFICGILALYQPEIGMLLERRERVYKNYRLAHNGEQPYEDRNLDITSSLPIEIEGRIAGLEAELKRRAAL